MQIVPIASLRWKGFCSAEGIRCALSIRIVQSREQMLIWLTAAALLAFSREGTQLLVNTQVATLDADGHLDIPNRIRWNITGLLVEIGCSDFYVMDDVSLPFAEHANDYLFSFEPMLDKYAVLLSRGSVRINHLVQPRNSTFFHLFKEFLHRTTADNQSPTLTFCLNPSPPSRRDSRAAAKALAPGASIKARASANFTSGAPCCPLP